MKKLFIFVLFLSSIHAKSATKNMEPEFIAIEHASFVIRAGGVTIFVDPVGNLQQYDGLGSPDIILYTHEHGDHLNIQLLKALKNEKTKVIGTPTVIEKTGFGIKIKNNEKLKIGKLKIESIPAYNTSPDRLKYHPKGIGNGYILTIVGKRIYISGDTEDTRDMRALKKIDYAFVCMNLPYTMGVEQAASAILDIKPTNVFPYHFRNQDKTYSDISGQLKSLLSKNMDIKIHYLNWYKNK